MKNLLTLVFVFSTFIAFANTALQTEKMVNNYFLDCIELPAGIIVTLQTTERINSREATVGQVIQLKVRTNVVTDGKVVIVSGAVAVGRIKSIKKATYNHPEEIEFEATAAQSVDGQMVDLNGTGQTIKGVYKGQGTFIEPGTLATANVMNTITIVAD